MARKKLPVRSLVFTYENNAWEKAFIGKLRKLFPQATCIGYQHSTTTPNFLYYYLSGSRIDRDYVPDFVITNGDYPTAFLKRNNYPPDRVVTGGALRYRSGKPAGAIPSGSPTHNNRILITPPGIIDEAAELLEKVYEALGPVPGLDLQVKIHPFLPRARLEERLPAGLAGRIRYTDRPVHELLPEANLLVYSTTSTCIEALSCGVPVLKIRSEHRLDLDPLGDFQGSTPFISVATQPDDIRDAVLRMKELEPGEGDRETIRKIVLSIFGPVDEETYRKFTLQKSGTGVP
jgi:surface carbohydrate biosynthesis protein (TIGR04326 family)